MPRSGTGSYTLPAPSPFQNGQTADATGMMTVLNDIATGERWGDEHHGQLAFQLQQYQRRVGAHDGATHRYRHSHGGQWHDRHAGCQLFAIPRHPGFAWHHYVAHRVDYQVGHWNHGKRLWLGRVCHVFPN